MNAQLEQPVKGRQLALWKFLNACVDQTVLVGGYWVIHVYEDCYTLERMLVERIRYLWENPDPKLLMEFDPGPLPAPYAEDAMALLEDIHAVFPKVKKMWESRMPTYSRL